MSDPIIQVAGVSKSYDISHQTKPKASYNTLKDDLVGFMKRPLGGRAKGEEHETFWALKDISFDVNQGEIFGIVGQNGSGKSTLLKILSRIVDPTEGIIKMHGRVASLLEVGTGFHPELTGRENIYFNGSMLGMSRQEIKSKFKDIVEFSEVEKFLDTPVKFYSSGMYVRLAFSVAAHLESEILILDEVLSVGDAGFQQKSLRKITDSMKQGRTVIFVSHSMGVVNQLCTRGLLLKNGHVEATGPIQTITRAYLERTLRPVSKSLKEKATEVTVTPEMYAVANPHFRITHMRALNSTSDKSVQIPFRKELEVELSIEVDKPQKQVRIALPIQTFDGVVISVNHHDDSGELKPLDLNPGKIYKFIVKIDNQFLSGKYVLGAAAFETVGKRTSIHIPSLLAFEVLDKDEQGTTAPTQEGFLINRTEWRLK